MSVAAVRKFTFDTVFDIDGSVLSAGESVKRSYTPDEVEEVRAAAFTEGERSATAAAEQAAAAALAGVSEHMKRLLGSLQTEASRLRLDACQLALAAARAAAGQAMARFGEEEPVQLFHEVATLLRDDPSITVRVAPELTDTVRSRLEAAADAIGFGGGVRVEPCANRARGDCEITWREGAAEIASEETFARVQEAAERWLAAKDADDQLDLFAAGGDAAEGAQ